MRHKRNKTETVLARVHSVPITLHRFQWEGLETDGRMLLTRRVIARKLLEFADGSDTIGAP